MDKAKFVNWFNVFIFVVEIIWITSGLVFILLNFYRYLYDVNINMIKNYLNI